MITRCLNCFQEFDDIYGVCPHCGYIPGQPAKQPFELKPGTKLENRYIIGTEVGVGGFGITYKAWDETLQQIVAVKEYYPSANGIVNRNPGEAKVIVYSGRRAEEFEKGRQRFLMEAKNMAKFSTHPNIVHVHDFFSANGTAYIVMEFLNGISYKEFIKQSDNERIDWTTAVEVTRSVLDALREIHKAGIIHRDISPDNVFILENGVIKLIDFGAARFSTGEEEKELSIILKPGYAPPEQYQSKSRQGPWTDIYAVGAMLYRAVVGRMPDESTNRAVKDEMVAPKELVEELPDYVNNAIMRAMAVNQELRFRNVDQFAEALKGNQTVLDDKEELKRRKRVRTTIVAAVFALLLSVGGITGFRAFRSYQAEHLNAAAIDLWYPQSEDEGKDGYLKDFEPMLENYRAAYGDVEVRVTGIPAGEYEKKLEEALKEGNAPDIFESTALDGAQWNDRLAALEDPNGFLTNRNWLEDYLFMEDYEKSFPEHKKLPLSVQIPVIYSDTALTGSEGTDTVLMTGTDELAEILSDSSSYAVKPEAAWMYADLASGLQTKRGYEDFVVSVELREDGENSEKTLEEEEKEREKKFKGKAKYYLSDSADYAKVQADMPGLYQIYLFSGTTVKARFDHLFSVSADSSPDEQKAAVRLVYYLMSEENQQTLNIRGKCGIPVHKGALGDYQGLNTEFAELDKSLAGAEIAD